MLKDTLHEITLDDIEYIISQNLPWENFRNQTVFISGANGFLPSYMVYTLLSLNEKFSLNLKVIALARNKNRAEERFKAILTRKDFLLLIQDVSDSIKCDEKIDFIIHAASQASPKYYGVDPVGTLNANTLGTNNLLHLAKKNHIKSFLFFSSSEVYGMVDETKIPTKENDFGFIDPTNVRSCYSESKRMGENMCVSWLYQFDIPIKIVRPFHTYGPGMDLSDGRVYADFIADIINNRNIIMKSDGNAMRVFCYLADATVAFFMVLLNGKNGEAYNVGNVNCEISIINLAQKLVKLFPEKDLKVIKFENTDIGYLKSAILRNCLDPAKINLLGWFPKTNIEEGFYRTIKTYL